jgi:hypothetical protein
MRPPAMAALPHSSGGRPQWHRTTEPFCLALLFMSACTWPPRPLSEGDARFPGGADGTTIDLRAGRKESSAADGGAGALPACGWPESLGEEAGQRCASARAYVDCEDSTGFECQCPGGDTIVPCPGCPTAQSCRDTCGPYEYAVTCGAGGIPPNGPSHNGQPLGCRFITAIPAGSVILCCPCR